MNISEKIFKHINFFSFIKRQRGGILGIITSKDTYFIHINKNNSKFNYRLNSRASLKYTHSDDLLRK